MFESGLSASSPIFFSFLRSLTPVFIPFITGLILGLVGKALLKVGVGVFAVLVLLNYAGYEKVPSVRDAFDYFVSNFSLGDAGFLATLPVTTPAFAVGIVLGAYLG